MSHRGGTSEVSPKWPKFRTWSGTIVRWAGIGMAVVPLQSDRASSSVLPATARSRTTLKGEGLGVGAASHGQGTMRGAVNTLGGSPAGSGDRLGRRGQGSGRGQA